MLALTLKHPWAYAVSHLGKPIENRSWKPWPSVVGEFIAIHGGAEPKGKEMARMVQDFVGLQKRGLLPAWLNPSIAVTPGIVAVTKLTGYVTASDDPWFEGPFGWTLADMIPLPEPVPCRGAQGLWMVPFDVARQVVEQVREIGIPSGI